MDKVLRKGKVGYNGYDKGKKTLTPWMLNSVFCSCFVCIGEREAVITVVLKEVRNG